MENISHSLPKRSFSSNSFNAAFTSHKSVYDDVFGGPPKFGLPTLAPRLEDYSEIFGGFHASRSSSIPLLHLPLIADDSDQRFDVRTPGFDYSEVFADFGGFDFTASFEDLIGLSTGGYDSSDDPWYRFFTFTLHSLLTLSIRSPAQSGSLSDELDPLAGSDKSHRLSDGDVHQSESINQFNISYNKSSQRNVGTVLTESSHVTNFSAVPGYTFSHYESPASWKGEDEHCSMHVNDDLNSSKEFGGRVTEEKYCKGLSNPLPNGFNTHGNDFNPLEKHGNSTSVWDKPFVTVSDISLRTKPSRLPPPSRPPPALVVKNGECGRSNSKLKASKSYAFNRVADDSSLFFDVEVDAAASAGDRENGSRNVKKVKHGSTKESIERKDMWDNSVMQVEEEINKTIRLSSNSGDEKMVQLHAKETAVSAHALEDRIGSRKGTEETSGSQDVEYHDDMDDNFSGVVAWREAKEYFEVIEENISRQAFDTVECCDTLLQHVNQDNYGHQMTTYYGAFNKKGDDKKFKETKEAPERNQPEMRGEHCDWGNMLQKEKPNERLSDRIEFEEKVILNKLPCICDLDMVIPENFQPLGESEKLNGNVSAVEDKLKLKASHKAMNIEKRFIDPLITKQNSGKHNQNILGEECQRRLEDVEGAETTEILKERAETTEILKERAETEGIGTSGTSGINENKLKQTHELKEKEVVLKEAKKHGHSGKNSCVDAGHEKGAVEQLSCEVDKDKKSLIEAGKQRVNELTSNEALEQVGNDKENKLIHGREAIKERNGDTSRIEENNLRFRMPEVEAGEREEAFARKDTMELTRDGLLEELSEHAEEIEPIDSIRHEAEVKWDMDDHVLIKGVQLKAGVDETLVKGNLNRFSNCKDELQDERTCNATNNWVESPSLPKQCGRGMGVSCVMPDKPSSVLECEPGKIMSAEDDEGQKVKEIQFICKRVDIRDSFIPCQVTRESLINGRKVEDDSSAAEQSDDTLCSMKNATCLRDKNFKENLAARNQKLGDGIRRQTEVENELMRKMEEEREREREREKDRMAVDKAALEAREKSYADARERAERAAVERATAEARQRAMAGARERLERASMEARLRADRAAVDRATAEAWQRAAEKSMAEKTASNLHDRVERSVPDRFSASFRSADTRKTSLSSRVAEALDAEVKRWSSGKEGNLRALLSTLQYILGPDSGWQPIPLTEVITSAAVKRAYRKATLCVHPDKLQQRGATIQQKYICEKVFDLLKHMLMEFDSMKGKRKGREDHSAILLHQIVLEIDVLL
ncbi:UNVERIFIED_CONTAM: Auxilin-like protein 1 [Sesamum radiatum]|uniref:Auxilin-like protein 1 n=1 Tax=Sesamum radiatum TaxID=300843 RepID=A0AAW2VRT2_SESRA